MVYKFSQVSGKGSFIKIFIIAGLLFIYLFIYLFSDSWIRGYVPESEIQGIMTS